jgi:maltoporin
VFKRCSAGKKGIWRRPFVVAAAVPLSLSLVAKANEVYHNDDIYVHEEDFEFNGYWRAGFNTASPFTGRELVDGAGGNSFSNFFQRLTQEAPDTQTSPRLKTSRHARDPNYLKFQMSKSFKSEVKFTFGMDTREGTAHESAEILKSPSDTESSAITAVNNFRIRDLYVQLPTKSDMRIWAGSRQLEFEDLRLFEAGNPFDTKALGFGLETERTFFSVGYSKSKREGVVEGISEEDRIARKAPPVLVETKDASLLFRREIPLESNYSVVPMVKLVIRGAAPADATTGGKRKAIRGSQEFLLGTIMARNNPETGGFGNTTMGVNLRPPDYSEESLRGDTTGYDAIYFIQDSSISNFIGWSLITAVAVEQTVFKNDQNVYRVQTDGAIVSLGEKTRKQRTVALGAQPVLYVTKSFHLALDVSYSFRDKKTSKTQSNALLVTPILRYALNENVLGSPQIYTSFTYGKYDLDFKKQIDGSFRSTLGTVQSGIELWF